MLRSTCFALLVTLGVGLELQAKLSNDWQKFKSLHGKPYTGKEDERRKQIFKKNVEAILRHNLRADLGEVSYTQGLNKYSDMDHDEFVKVMCGVPIPENFTFGDEVMVPRERVNAPESLDWRTSGLVTPVKDQGKCGSCWTFSSVGTIEGAWAKSTEELVTLSEQNILDCSSNIWYGNQGCKGGYPSKALLYVVLNKGVNADSCYSYKGEVGTCKFDASCKTVKISKFVDLPRGNEKALMEAVANHGPVSVGLYASNPDFRQYKGGVYDPTSCKQQPNHAVTVVGYGNEDGKAFWLVKNSWGETWGDEGYFKMVRNKGNKCGIANLSAYAVV